MAGHTFAMRTTLGALNADFESLTEAAFAAEHGDGFLVADPVSAFHIPSGPHETMRIDRKAFDAFTRGAYHASTPAFVVRTSDDSPYSFISIGRTDNCDVALPDESISKLHALIRRKGDAFTVQDTDSANGTFVDETPVPKRGDGDAVTLVPGCVLRVGRVKLHFVDVTQLVALFGRIERNDAPNR